MLKTREEGADTISLELKGGLEFKGGLKLSRLENDWMFTFEQIRYF